MTKIDKVLKDETKKVSLDDALKEHKPLTLEEANKLMKRIDSFYKRLRKEYGGERFDLYTSTIQAIVHPEGMLTNLRGNMHTSQFAIANALNIIIENVTQNLKLSRETVLLYCITDLAQEVRGLWQQIPTQIPPPSDGTQPTKVPVEPTK